MTTVRLVSCQTALAGKVSGARELRGYSESRANRCLTLLERCQDAVPKGLWVPSGTKPRRFSQKTSPELTTIETTQAVKKRMEGREKNSQAETQKKEIKKGRKEGRKIK